MKYLFSVGFLLQGSFAFVSKYAPFKHQSTNLLLMVLKSSKDAETSNGPHTWSPQDLTDENGKFMPIPTNDYIKKYQSNQDLWPVEFFIIPYRRIENARTKMDETQILVRKSANGTAKYGLGTGVPVTRWLLSSQKNKPPKGYQIRQPELSFDASNFPEFPADCRESWTYTKIDMMDDAFQNNDQNEFNDPELENFSKKIRDQLKSQLETRMKENYSVNKFELDTLRLVSEVLDQSNSIPAIQGSLRMSGLFANRKEDNGASRYVQFDDAEVDPAKLAESVRIYTMFPQMPDPIPLPSTSAEELKKEIIRRPSVMKKSGRDPHKDKYGRKFTHISTSNVSNTIHGIYIPVSMTNISDQEDIPPAFDLFGVEEIEKVWVSLFDLNVVEEDQQTISVNDTKPVFISGFIVRQLVKDGAIQL